MKRMTLIPKKEVKFEGESVYKIHLIGQSLIIYADWVTPVPIIEWHFVQDKREVLEILELNGLRVEDFKIIEYQNN